MDHGSRLIGLAFVVGWTIFRLLQYLRISRAKRAPRAAPPATAAAATVVAPTASPIGPAGAAGSGVARKLVAAAVFIPGTVVVWSLLFMVPALEDLPPLLRMIAGVLATLYLLHLASSVAARAGGTRRRGDAADNDPIK